MLGRISALIRKELLMILRDPKARFVLIFPPIFQLFIFALAATLDVKDASIAVLNRDNGEQAIELIQRFRGAPTFSQIRYLNSVEEITPIIDNQDALMVLHIDELFSRNLDAGKQADIQLIFDGRKSNTAQIVAGYALGIVQQFNDDFAVKAGITLQSTELVARNWFNPNLLYYWFNLPNLTGILTMLIGLVVTGLSIARERELGTFDQLLVSPLLPFEILIGKAVPAILIGIGEGSIIIFAAVFIFQVPFVGSVLLLYLSMLVFICSIIGIGLFLSSLCSTQQQAILGTFVFMSPAVLLSGYATPIENMPIWMQKVTLLNPVAYFLVISKGIYLKAMPFSMVFNNLWPMALIALFTLTAAAWLFRRRLE
jgi:ABC-2 type transport system permease protein